jgi:predicted dehydrogenase
MLGYAFMGKAHVNAYRTLPYIMWPAPLTPRLISIAGRSKRAVADAATRFGFADYTTDWRNLVSHPDVQLFDNSGPNGMHAEPTIAAAKAGKHLLCEKPLGRNADESFDMWRSAARAGVKHMTAFNYRFVPAMRLAKEMIEAGDIGEIFHFRGSYLQDWLVDPAYPHEWRLDRDQAGSGALGDLGAHVIDLARYLVGEVEAVSASTRTLISERPGGAVTVDDAFISIVDFASGASGMIEASRFAFGRKNALIWEINGSKGSMGFDLERINELRVAIADSEPGRHAQGFRDVLVTEPYHPWLKHWWPEGHVLGWEHTFVNEICHLLEAIAEDSDVGPYGATFEDGYRAAEICDAILRASENGDRQEVRYRSV